MVKSTTLNTCPPTLIRNQTLTLPCPLHTLKQPRKPALHSAAIRAAQDNIGRPRRLIDIIRIIPETSKDYFKKPLRRVLFGGISLLGGFYIAQTVSLSFGALGVNDVISAVLCVLMTEYATRFYYSRRKVSFPAALLNIFKLGFTYGLFLDAFKLAS
ncbi:UNVERIFIED_CONTAM: Ycf20-like protein [Sesamum latifolium]|uniref:Ycf20-like protein n=1 Tax=Sesamum latifolium TaxID=2727402 RepID=A0AAW2XCP9_9LAMI